MKYKRKILSVGLAALILSSTFAFGSVVELDPILEKAEEFAQTLFETELGKEEQESKELLGILGEEVEEPKSGYIHASYLQGLDGEEDYILVQRENGGYAIFEKESMEVIEYSNLSSTPYQASLTERYYAGPANYYEKKDGKVKNIHTGETFKEEHLTQTAKEIKNRLKKNREERKEKQNTKGVVASNVILTTGDPGPTGSQEKPADSYIVHSRTYIPEYKFFVGNTHHGDNNDNSCASVATQLLLAYNNWAKDGRIIPENDDLRLTNGEEFFSSDYDREDYFDKPYSDQMRETTSEENRAKEPITFYEKIEEYVNKVDPETGSRDWIWENGVINTITHIGIQQYLSDYYNGDWTSEIDINSMLIGESSAAEAVIKQEIDEGRPAIASIWCYTAKSSGYKKEGHCVVAYGYQTIVYEVDGVNQNIDGIIAHFGWKNVGDKTNIWFNSDWLNGYVTMETSHSHTAYEEPYSSTNTHVRKCTLCGVTYANAEHTYNETSTEILLNSNTKYRTHHSIACACGYKQLEAHNFWIEAIEDDVELMSTYHYLKCSCGYSPVERHAYYATAIGDSKMHLCICACGRSYPESHFAKAGHSSVCFSCGERFE